MTLKIPNSLVPLLQLNPSIAFKPAESGWGANSKYTNNFDKIFAKKDAQIINDDGKRHDDGEGGAKSIDEQKAE